MLSWALEMSFIGISCEYFNITGLCFLFLSVYGWLGPVRRRRRNAFNDEEKSAWQLAWLATPHEHERCANERK